MYRTLIRSERGAIDKANRRVFLPVLAAYEIHSVHIDFLGCTTQHESIDFRIDVPFIHWLDDGIANTLRSDDHLFLHVDYFYRKAETAPECLRLGTGLIRSTLTHTPTSAENAATAKREQIFVKHYIDGQFALDNGLFKEAVVNFGTVVEVLLNTELKHANLTDLIATTPLASGYHTQMHFIRKCRNKVHPNRLRDFDDVTRIDAIQCRQNLDLIINDVADLAAF
ncbi:MAG: hypothetical protein JXM70_23190 [Pirellulales bacterium]|nr:hypothetical protein [Pirellulales bacterium]